MTISISSVLNKLSLIMLNAYEQVTIEICADYVVFIS